MRSFRDRNPYAVGLVSVTVIAILVAGAFLVGILHVFDRFSGAYKISAVFSDAAGVVSGDDVRVAGVKAGRVASVKADLQHGKVIVKMVINGGVELGPDTTAEVALQTLLGTKFVRLAGEVREPRMRAGAVIPSDRTKTPFDVFDLVNVSKRAIDETDTKRLNEFIGQLADVTQGRREDVGRLLEGLSKVSQALADRHDELQSLLDRGAKLTGTLADKDQTLLALIDQSTHLLAVLRDNRRNIAGALEGSDRLTAQLASILDQHQAELDRILATLHPTVAVLDRRQADLNRVLAFLGPGVLGLAKATTHGPWADIYVRSVGPDAVQALCDLRHDLGVAGPCE
jgi:phospholipid/cholesterol/gamma-HCH transport system substrate-binding protein